ncbi:hypothetical protein [Streptomyces sp. NPDC059916]|uniref:hypothetical protein n=1 Tax=Streptomyces sp. NPDC059916 TaxID=3347001 RepID=UPI00367D8738
MRSSTRGRTPGSYDAAGRVVETVGPDGALSSPLAPGRLDVEGRDPVAAGGTPRSALAALRGSR